jgi:hypothetical protein
MSPPSEVAATPEQKPSVFERRKWVWPTVLGASIGIGFRLVFLGGPGEAYSAMMASFALLVPMVIGAVAVVAAERSARRSWGYYFWAGASANALCVVVALLIAIEGLICVILAVPLFVVLGGIAGLVTGLVCRLTNRPRRSVLGFAVLPLLLGGFEQRLPLPHAVLREERAVVIAAPANVVWQQLLSVRDIKPEEMNQAWMYRIGVPLPQSAITESVQGALVRHVTMGKSVQFDQVATDWSPNRRVLWTYRFTKDSFPPKALDDHVRIGGTYFDIVDTEYALRELPGGTELRVTMQYRVSTNFNWYIRPIAAFLIGNFEDTALNFYARRSEFARNGAEAIPSAIEQ